jgi:nitrogen fixation negative regulator NifL
MSVKKEFILINTYKDKLNKFEKLFNLSIDMQCIAGTDGYFKTINPAFSRTLGFDDETLLSHPLISFVHPDDVESTLLEIEKLKQGFATVNFENRYRHLDGSYRILSWSTSTDTETSDNLLYCVARDVTHLNEARYRFKQINNALNTETIVAMTDTKGNITEMNELFCEISGYSRNELMGKNHRILNSGKHPKTFFVNLWNTISSGKAWSGLIQNRRKNGELYFVQSVITPIFNIQGDITHYLAIRLDITEHMLTRDTLTKTLGILSETSHIAKVGGWELDLASGDQIWTDQTFKILGVEKKHDQKPKLPEGLELFTPQYKSIVERAVQRAIELGEPYDLEVQAQTPAGDSFWVATNGKANYKNGKVVSISGTIQDINLRKTTELNYELERFKSIQNAKMASLGELSAGIAHEINNPLAIIEGTTHLLRRYVDQPEQFNIRIETIKKSSHRIARIVQSLQKFSRTNEKRIFGSFSLNRIIQEAITLTEVRAKRYSVTVAFEPLTSAVIICDEIEIEQVIVNLINNAIDAIKHSSEKWIKLVTILRDHQLILTVFDSGPAIPEKIKQRLFDPFFTTKKNGEGTGLGLSISKSILEEHYADIYIDSDSTHTCFVITFNKIDSHHEN